MRLVATALYVLEFCCAGIILGIYSYFLSVLADRNIRIATWKKAVEGLSGAACVYLIFAVLLTCFLGGKSFFAFLAILLDLLFFAAFLALAVLTRDGADSCKGNVQTPLGNGPSNSKDPGYGANGFGLGVGENVTYAPKLGLACRLNTAAFAVSIIGAFLFLCSAVLQFWLHRHHKKEKRYGPSPANGYTSGPGKRRFWQRKPKANKHHTARDAELAGAGALPKEHHTDYRPSHDTGYTGDTTVAPGAPTALYDAPGHHTNGAYHTTPLTTNNAPRHTNF